MSEYNKKFSPALRVRFSMLNLQINGGLLSSPAPWLDGSTNYGEWLRVSSCQLETEVCRLEGAARFILGLYDDIELLGGEELRGYVGYRVRMMGN